MSNTVIKVENLSKQYRLGIVGTGTLHDDLSRWWASIRGKEDPFLMVGDVNNREEKGESDYVWALKDINFEVAKGEVLGIIGKNGAGKSTLLKILSQVTHPTAGSVKMKGKIASLLEVGTGFHPDLTGRENIFLNGAIMGMTTTEIKRKFDEIVDFSGVEKYIDTPVKRYSSGMYVRLAFAVAAHLDPEILIVDEVLAVGDIEFQNKSLGKMQDVSQKEGRTVLFVSHSMSAIQKICNSGILLKNGKISFSGTASETVDNYLSGYGLSDTSALPAIFDAAVIAQKSDGMINTNDTFININQISIQDTNGNARSKFKSTEAIQLKFEFDIRKFANDFRILISIVDHTHQPVLHTQLHDLENYHGRVNPGKYISVCKFPSNLFASRIYTLVVHFFDVKQEHHILNELIRFQVTYDNPKYTYGPMDDSLFRPNFDWMLKQLN